MSYSVFGQVVGARKFSNGDIEIDFYSDEEIIEYRYTTDSLNPRNFPKELAQTLMTILATDVCAEIFFSEDDIPTHIELEECDYDEEELEQEF
ncbi:MAG: hypothetical protein GWN01_03000 [Nitrosopumilaceae archaeon]|nr:hypothetical protein [Nitrosopumilaceae archaeon]NIT99933.1 hypothetical protein [Nitrosopumilaceae archaeon]NIU86287.1 hypothetical protein [Nitrosopumilaceae archaeon]NIV65042.1 hypothetical protein [Nitrosopumilaceae archaeon]NIX60536.1 hypothetical protein [Nitrosopumilaceae archaeon]